MPEDFFSLLNLPRDGAPPFHVHNKPGHTPRAPAAPPPDPASARSGALGREGGLPDGVQSEGQTAPDLAILLVSPPPTCGPTD